MGARRTRRRLGPEAIEELQQFAPEGQRDGHLLAVNLGATYRPQLAKLRGKRLAVGTDAGPAERPVLRVLFGRIWRNAQPIEI